MKESTVIA